MWKNGFTLIELILVIGITLVLAVAAIPIFGNLQVNTQLNEQTSQLIQTIRLSREQTLAGVGNQSHGIYIDVGSPGKYILFEGESYATRNMGKDREQQLDHVLSISTDLTGNELVFDQTTGRPQQTGSITLSHSVEGSRVVVINSLGLVEEN